MRYKHYSYFVEAPYFMQFACFECRKSFKQKVSFVLTGPKPRRCPECGEQMWEMGRQFKAPRQSNIKQWRKVEALVRNGITFHSQGYFHLLPMPGVLREVAPFVESVREREMSEGERLMTKLSRKRRKAIE